jgi:thymidine kinase
MAKLYFSYAAMNAGKSTVLLQAAHNYAEQGMEAYLLNAALDDRNGTGKISSRIGIQKVCDLYGPEDDLFIKIERKLKEQAFACVLVDEAQWLSKEQVWQLARVVDELNIAVMCYGLRTDFQGELFPGSEVLLALADELREIRTICHCGRKAVMTLRTDGQGRVMTDGPQTQVGGNEAYISVCRRHWSEAREKGSL